MSSILTILLLQLSATVLSADGRPPQKPAAPMNVVVLVIDDTRWDSIGAAGNTIVRTPRLDQLAGDGIRFTQARVTTSICTTSRASLLTGQYMSRHGIDRFGKPLTEDAFARTYPGQLRAAGYWTGLCRQVRRRRAADHGLRFSACVPRTPLDCGCRRRASSRDRAECSRFHRVPARTAERQAFPSERRLFRAARRRQRQGTVLAPGVERGALRGSHGPALGTRRREVSRGAAAVPLRRRERRPRSLQVAIRHACSAIRNT